MKHMKFMFTFCLLLCLTLTAQAAAPVISQAKLITSRYIELDWQGSQYINGAGASKENTTANHTANFEVKLNGTTLAQTSPWYWNITNYTLHGVTVNQNKTTLRLSTALTSAQMTAIQNGTSTLTVRIASTDVTGSGDPANTTTIYNVVNKPYYTNTIVSKAGVPIKGSEYVLLSTVQKAADMVDVILSAAPSSLTSRMASQNQFMIFGPGEHSYNIPEHRDIFLRDAWNRAEGYGGSVAATSAANVERHHNIPAAQRPYNTNYRSGYTDESILAHEFGHGILNPGMNANTVVNPGAPANTSMRTEHIAIYTSSRATPENPNNPNGRKKWDGANVGSSTYMSANNDEFMATAVAIWFNAMANSNTWTDNRGALNAREQLRLYDTPFYNFLSRVLPETKALSEAWATGVPSTGNPYIHPAPAEPTGKYGPSVKVKSTLATNPAGSGLQMYIPFNAAANTVTNVELWWDVNTDLMRWYLDPDANESYFRIRKKIERSYTQNQQNSNMVLMPTGSGTTAGTRIVVGTASNSDESQWWSFKRQADESYVITNKLNPQMAITLENDATASGTRIALGTLTSNSRFWNIDGNVSLGETTQPSSSSITLSSSSSGSTPIRIAKISNGSLFAYASGNTIILGNLPVGAKIEVYGLNGKLISGKSYNRDSDMSIQVQAKGLYVVKVEKQTLRVVVR